MVYVLPVAATIYPYSPPLLPCLPSHPDTVSEEFQRWAAGHTSAAPGSSASFSGNKRRPSRGPGAWSCLRHTGRVRGIVVLISVLIVLLNLMLLIYVIPSFPSLPLLFLDLSFGVRFLILLLLRWCDHHHNSSYISSSCTRRGDAVNPLDDARAQSGRAPSKYPRSCPSWQSSHDPQEVANAQDYSSFESLSDFGLSMSDFGATPQQVADT